MKTFTPSELLVATRNAGKVLEYRALLDALPFRLRTLDEFPAVAEVEETGETFAENAALKAGAYAAATRLWTLADDSGLEVDALGGAPGIFSARYGGAGASDAERINRLLEELSGFEAHQRGARFICAIAIADPEAQIANLSTGKCEGRIATRPGGAHGFGYDPVFIPEGYERTFGELPDEIKEKISHRAQALAGTRSFLLKHFGKAP
ncbi:MAG TPA: RdgB/HAM1 family non-canonical purine NTP pyrophosphatase [Pyrinomonadaceae bacterium]|jgi:XTP/dITP diphosphohydrolase